MLDFLVAFMNMILLITVYRQLGFEVAVLFGIVLSMYSSNYFIKK